MTEVLQLLVSGLATGCVYGLVALGFVLIYKAAEVVNFAQGDLLMLGAFLALTFITTLELGFWLGTLCAVIAMAVVGWLLDAVVIRQVIGQPQFSTVMLTIGIGMVIRSVAAIAWGPDTRSLATPFSTGMVSVAGVPVSSTYLSIIGGTVLLCAVLFAFFRYTRVGVAMQAASQNQLAAYFMGMPVKTLLSAIWALAAAVSTLAGVLVAPVSLIDPNMGHIALRALAGAVLGGFGSIPGALVGGAIVGIAELFAAAWVDEKLRDIVPHVILLLVLVLRPQGLFGAVGRKKV
ncbi:MAG: branched-chain amino acid ABC transporter permease [Burkholderiales bacterium]|jgi:branched-chain amino acid transport system permease protein